MEGLITERLNDFREQEKRKANVKTYGIKELDSDEAERVEEIDKTKVTQFFNEQLKVQSVRIPSTKRVGKKTSQSDAANNTSGYIRPIKITLDSEALKHRIYKQYWTLKGQKVKLSYGLSNDHTRGETVRYKQLKEELARRESQGDDSWLISKR